MPQLAGKAVLVSWPTPHWGATLRLLLLSGTASRADCRRFSAAGLRLKSSHALAMISVDGGRQPCVWRQCAAADFGRMC